jgi:hypothetical protein
VLFLPRGAPLPFRNRENRENRENTLFSPVFFTVLFSLFSRRRLQTGRANRAIFLGVFRGFSLFSLFSLFLEGG